MSVKVQFICTLQCRCDQDLRWIIFRLLLLKFIGFILWCWLSIYSKHTLIFLEQICSFELWTVLRGTIS